MWNGGALRALRTDYKRLGLLGTLQLRTFTHRQLEPRQAERHVLLPDALQQ